MRLIIYLVLFCLSIPSQAGLLGKSSSDSIYLNMTSKHANNGYNDSHEVLGIQYKGVYLMTFNNSLDRRTYSVGISREYMRECKDLRYGVGVKVGLINAYRDKLPHIGDIALMATPFATAEYKRLGVDIIAMPFNGGSITVLSRLKF